MLGGRRSSRELGRRALTDEVPMPDEKRPDWLADQQSKEEWMQTRRSMRAVPVAERERPLEDMPSWLAEVQPKKKEWSPVQDRIDAHFAGVRELAERRRRRRERLFKRFRNMVDWTAALVEARNELKAQAAEAKAAATAPLIERPPAAPLPPASVAPQPPPSKPSQH